MTLSRSPSAHRPSLALAALAFIAAAGVSGCVTRGAHQSVVAERDQLSAENFQLQKDLEAARRSTKSLDNERVKLVAQNDSLLDAREKLESEVAKLRKTREELSTTLVATQTELEAQQEEVDRLRGTYDGLVADLESEVAAGQIEIEQLREGIRLNVSDEVLFATGSAKLGPDGEAVLAKVAGQLKGIDQRIEVQGHSDNIPIRGGLRVRYPSNWELAAARAASVVRLLQREGVAGERLSAVSFAEYRPVAPNDTAEGRALNRRIEIRLLPPEESPDADSSP
jgi:chemotaxis protein MotB